MVFPVRGFFQASTGLQPPPPAPVLQGLRAVHTPGTHRLVTQDSQPSGPDAGSARCLLCAGGKRGQAGQGLEIQARGIQVQRSVKTIQQFGNTDRCRGLRQEEIENLKDKPKICRSSEDGGGRWGGQTHSGSALQHLHAGRGRPRSRDSCSISKGACSAERARLLSRRFRKMPFKWP